MINLDNITNENNEEHNEKWPYMPYHPYKILIIGGSGSGKTNILFNLTKQQDNIENNYLSTKELNEPKYDFLIKMHENVGIQYCNNPNTFIEYSNLIDDVYKNIDDYTPNRKRKKIIVFDKMIARIMENKKCQAIIKELFIRCTKLNNSLVFF